MFHDLLETMILRETVAEILAQLRPEERKVAVLRLAGLTDTEIGDVLALERTGVTWRMLRAQERIARELPEAAHLVQGRRLRLGRRPSSPSEPLLAVFWLCDGTPNDGFLCPPLPTLHGEERPDGQPSRDPGEMLAGAGIESSRPFPST
jgi:hypothetical protein